MGEPLAEVEQSNFGCDFTEVGAELIHSWGMPVQIEQAIRHQLCPDDAVTMLFTPPSSTLPGWWPIITNCIRPLLRQRLAFHASALQSTRFNVSERPALLNEALDQLQDTVKLFSPVAMAA